MINETRFQYIRTRHGRTATTSFPLSSVQEAFISGGSQVGLAHNDEDRWELQNYSMWTKGKHVLRFGLRLRGVTITDFSPQNFGGTFTFSGGDAPQLDANNRDRARCEWQCGPDPDHKYRALSQNASVSGRS